jgi:hypothetical protein
VSSQFPSTSKPENAASRGTKRKVSCTEGRSAAILKGGERGGPGNLNTAEVGKAAPMGVDAAAKMSRRADGSLSQSFGPRLAPL